MKSVDFKQIRGSILEGILKGIPEFEYWATHVYEWEGGLQKMLDSFRYYLEEKQILSDGYKLKLAMAQDLICDIVREIDVNVLTYVDRTLMLDETELEMFRVDYENSKTGNSFYNEARYQKYKTITSFFILEEVNGEYLKQKYYNSSHPLINSQLAELSYNSKLFDEWVNNLANGANYALRTPNIYWHNVYALLGCYKIIWDIIIHYEIFNLKCLEHSGIKNLEIRLYKLLFLIMSRIINMDLNLLQSPDVYSNRADLFYQKGTLMMSIFMQSNLMINPEVQFVSDKYLSFARANKLGVGTLFQDQFKESKMMYQYGALHVNSGDTGLAEIEDATWLQLVERGRMRADKVACDIYKSYNDGSLGFKYTEIEKIILQIRRMIPFKSKEIESSMDKSRKFIIKKK